MLKKNKKANDSKIQQSKGFLFNFVTTSDKLVIEVSDKNSDNQQYSGSIYTHPLIDFESIKEFISKGQYKVLFQDKDLLKLKIGASPIELVSKSKNQISQLKDKFNQSLEKQKQMEKTIELQKAEIISLKRSISGLKSNTKSLNQKFEKISKKIKLNEQLNSTTLKQQNHSSLYNLSSAPEGKKMDQSFKWSVQLKSKNIQTNDNVVTLTYHWEYNLYFCLLNASFSNTIKSKQSWAIKINKKTNFIFLGVCLKSKILECECECEFKSFRNKIRETGHGLYMIDSVGYCWSHTQKEFNNLNKSFNIYENDLILIEYDPIDLKLRFSKNKAEYFELPIPTPPQNDSYHPCAGINFSGSSIELIPFNQQQQNESRQKITKNLQQK